MESEEGRVNATFEQVLTDLKKQFREKRKELQELRDRIMELEQAKKVMSSAVGQYVHTVPMQRELILREADMSYRGTTLREAALEVLRQQGATTAEKAMSAREVAMRLDKRRGPMTEKASFYTQVYIVLRRAATTLHSRGARGAEELPKVSIETTGKGRRFYLT